MIYCPHCGSANRANSKFCSNCSGELKLTVEPRCAVCGVTNAPGAVACTRCGSRLDGKKLPAAQDKPPVDGPREAAPTPAEQSSAEIPEWLQRFSESQERVPEEEDGAGGPTTWLNNSRDQSTEGQDETLEEETESPARDNQAPFDFKPEPGWKLPAWLQATEDPNGPEPGEGIAAENSSVPAESDSGLPEWLDDLQDQNEPAEAQTRTPDESDEGIPLWLQELSASQSLPESSEQPGDRVFPLSSLGGEDQETFNPAALESSGTDPLLASAGTAEAREELQGTPELEEAEQPQDDVKRTTEEPGLPDWLAAASPAQSAESPHTTDEGSLPGWLAGKEEPAGAFKTESGENASYRVPEADRSEPGSEFERLAVPATVEEEKVSTGSNESEGAIIENVESIRVSDESATPEKAPYTASALAIDEVLEGSEIPEWVRELAPAELETTAEDESGLPEWLGATPTTSENNFKTGAGEVKRELTIPAEPSRIGHVEPITEEHGPLAGLGGVIPLARATTESHSLEVLAPLRTNGGKVFADVLAGGRETPSAQVRAKAGSQGLRNRIIYLGVLLAALIPLFLPNQLAGLGLFSTFNTPTVAFHDSVDALPPGSTALVAFDYDPGQSLEMESIARVIVGDLARRKVNVIAASLNPAGAQLAQSVLNRAAAENSGWQADTNFVNAGYLRGDEKGLRDLATAWFAVDQKDLSGRPLNSLELTSGVKGFKDISLVVELAATDNTLRSWMEQVQPVGQVPVVAGVGAEVQTVAGNYYSSRQLAGMVRGLAGAAEYQGLTQQPGMALHLVDAQSFIQLFFVLLIAAANVALVLNRKPS